MRTLLLLLALALVPTSLPLSTPETVAGLEPATPQQSTLADAISLLHRWEKRGPVTDTEEVTAAEQALADLDLAWSGKPVWRSQIQISWLDFLGRSIRIADQVAEMEFRKGRETTFGVHGESELRRRTVSILRRRLPQIRTWLTREVLLGGDRHPLGRRVAACEVLAEDDGNEVVLALFSCTRSAPPELIDAAVGALAGRDLVEVHKRLIELLARADEGKIGLGRGAIERHFAGTVLSPDHRELVEEVRMYVQGTLADEDWRRASRGVSIARCLPHEAAFPTLISGMEVWVERADGERPVKRVLGELEAELRRRSGRQLGMRPDRWRVLWEAYQRGEVNLTGQNGRDGLITQAEFFGLRPVTDRVTFVLDRSGSMDTVFGESQKQSRLREAADRLSAFLEQMGPDTRFEVVAFSDEAHSWKKTLQPASRPNIESARRWVIKNGAEGGTHLKAGVLTAMHVDKTGKIDLEALEADTVIVLCDGATAEGPGWVLPLLRRTNDEGRLIFHAVQIGSGGDGTLEVLCEATGGDFVRVEG